MLASINVNLFMEVQPHYKHKMFVQHLPPSQLVGAPMTAVTVHL